VNYLNNSEEHLLSSATCAGSRPSDIMIGAHIILTHSLLDRLADALGLQGADSMQLTPRKPYAEFSSDKFVAVIERLKDWEDYISRARNNVFKHVQHGEAQDYQVFANEVENPTPDQRRLMAAASNLAKGVTRLRRIEGNQVALNLELMAFAVVWYGEVSVCLFIY
jgi:chitinase